MLMAQEHSRSPFCKHRTEGSPAIISCTPCLAPASQRHERIQESVGFLVEFGVFLHWYTIELLMTAKENDSLIENSSNFTEGSGMVKLTLRKLTIIKHSYCKFLIENLYSKSAVNLTPNKAFANFIFSQTVQLWMSHTHVFSLLSSYWRGATETPSAKTRMHKQDGVTFLPFSRAEGNSLIILNFLRKSAQNKLNEVFRLPMERSSISFNNH